MKDYIKKHRDEINSFVSPLIQVKPKRNGSVSDKKYETTQRKYPVVEVIRSIDDELSREKIAAYYREDLYKGFVATLLWIGMFENEEVKQPYVFACTFEKEYIVRKLERVKEMLAKGKIIEAVDSMLGGINEIVAFGSDHYGLQRTFLAYVSRVIYFLAYDLNLPIKPLIYDWPQACIHCALLDWENDHFPYYWCEKDEVNEPKTTFYIRRYDYQYETVFDIKKTYWDYLNIMHSVAKECNIERVDNLEGWLSLRSLDENDKKDLDDSHKRFVVEKSREVSLKWSMWKTYMLCNPYEDKEDAVALVRIFDGNGLLNLMEVGTTYPYKPSKKGCNKDNPFVINETDNYVHLERSIMDVIYQYSEKENSFIQQKLMNVNGRKIDCLTFKVWPVGTDEPTTVTATNTEKYFFDITDGYNDLKTHYNNERK